jgi:hypothetical protein
MLSAAIASGDIVANADIRRVRVAFGDEVTEFFADVGFLLEFGMPTDEEVVALRDRDKARKQLNDRLTIEKILGAMRKSWVCPVCLQELIDSSR